MTEEKKGEPMIDDIIEVKCWSVSFQALKDGSKRFEYRKDDRPYEVGKTVHQREWNPDTSYTGDDLYHDITWIIRGGSFGIPEGFCIFSVTEPRKIRACGPVEQTPTLPTPCANCTDPNQCYVPCEREHVPAACPYWNKAGGDFCKVANEITESQKAAIAAQARERVLREVLTYFKFSCPGGEITPICDMCSANPYCIELRPGQEREPE